MARKHLKVKGWGTEYFLRLLHKFFTFIWAYKLNVFSVFHLCQLCAPHMEAAGGGAILNISSMSAENKNKKMAA